MPAPPRRLHLGKLERAIAACRMGGVCYLLGSEWGGGAVGALGKGVRGAGAVVPGVACLPSAGRVGRAAGAGERRCRRLSRVLGCPLELWSEGTRFVPAPRVPWGGCTARARVPAAPPARTRPVSSARVLLAGRLSHP